MTVYKTYNSVSLKFPYYSMLWNKLCERIAMLNIVSVSLCNKLVHRKQNIEWTSNTQTPHGSAYMYYKSINGLFLFDTDACWCSEQS